MPTQMPITGRPPDRRRSMIQSPRASFRPFMQAAKAPTPGTSSPSAFIALSKSRVISTSAPARARARSAERTFPKP